MATDSQILALSTMFTEDVFAHYEGQARFGEAAQVQTGRAFVIGLTVVAYFDRAAAAREHLRASPSSTPSPASPALSLLLLAALFWRGSTKWGALASTLWVAASVLGIAAVNANGAGAAPGTGDRVWSLGGLDAGRADRRAACQVLGTACPSCRWCWARRS